MKVFSTIRRQHTGACIIACACILIGAFNIFGQGAGMQKSSEENQYPFKKGDAFRIVVFPDTAHFLNGVYHIDDSGKVFLPVIGTMKVSSITEKNLTLLLDTIYLPYLRYPNVLVQPLVRVSLLGGFIKPGLFYVSPRASLWDAIELAGGTIREDGIKKIKWARDGSIVKKDLLTDFQAGTSLSSMGFRSGDQIFVTHVPKRDSWEIFREEVLPLLSLVIGTAATAATAYFTFETYQSRK